MILDVRIGDGFDARGKDAVTGVGLGVDRD